VLTCPILTGGLEAAVTLFRPSSGVRIVLFTILVAFAVLMAVDLSLKGLANQLVPSG
jgi:hypothetical protein